MVDRRRFGGRVVIVTGSGSGIGATTAEAFAAEGAAVLVADIDERAARATVSRIEAAGHTAIAVPTDVADPQAVEAMVDSAVSRFGRLDVLHNNAYWAPLNTAVTDTELPDWERTIAVTLTGVFLGAKAAIPRMLANGGGVIVNTSSAAALVASPKFAAYMAAKAGVVGLTRSIAFDYGQQGIRCNAVCPGLIETPASAPAIADPQRRAWMESKLLVGRIGQPDDIAATVLFLASDESGYLTGQVITVDGGRTIA